MAFDTFIGNRKVIDRLRAKLREGRFPHGLIFSGPAGLGKHTCALMMAKALNCLQAGPDQFCDSCSQCHKINAGTHPDVLQISVEEDASEIKIAQIRHILQMLEMRPLEGRNKVFIIDPANRMNESATNALLKGLEEPPDNSFFIFISTNVHELLLTVRSRSQVYHFTPIPLDELRRSEKADDLVLRWSRGSIGLLRTLDVAGLKKQREVIIDFLEVAIRANESQFSDMLAASADLSRSKNEFESHLTVIGIVLGDLIYMKEGATDKIVNIDIKDRLAKLANDVSSQRLIELSDFLKLMETSMKTYVKAQMLTDVLALAANEGAAKILHDNPGKSR